MSLAEGPEKSWFWLPQNSPMQIFPPTWPVLIGSELQESELKLLNNSLRLARNSERDAKGTFPMVLSLLPKLQMFVDRLVGEEWLNMRINELQCFKEPGCFD